MEENVSEKVILVIEHNQNHAQLIQAILKEESLQNQVVVMALRQWSISIKSERMLKRPVLI
jgi:hypothetical protein